MKRLLLLCVLVVGCSPTIDITPEPDTPDNLPKDLPSLVTKAETTKLSKYFDATVEIATQLEQGSLTEGQAKAKWREMKDAIDKETFSPVGKEFTRVAHPDGKWDAKANAKAFTDLGLGYKRAK